MSEPPIDTLRRIAARTPTAADLDWLSGRVGTYLAEPERGLDAALDLAPGPGQSPWWQAERRRRRDATIRRLAEHFPHARPWRTADSIVSAARRYQSSSWLRDQHRSEPPQDPVKALLWTAMKTGTPFPASARH